MDLAESNPAVLELPESSTFPQSHHEHIAFFSVVLLRKNFIIYCKDESQYVAQIWAQSSLYYEKRVSTILQMWKLSLSYTYVALPRLEGISCPRWFLKRKNLCDMKLQIRFFNEEKSIAGNLEV